MLFCFQVVIGGGLLSLLLLLIYSYSNPVVPVSLQTPPMNNYAATSDSAVLPEQSLSPTPVTQLQQQKDLTQNPQSINVAPHLPFYPKLCSNPKLLGRPHKGGWYVCADESLKSTPRNSGEVAGNNSTWISPQKQKQCVVYSFGLGADW